MPALLVDTLVACCDMFNSELNHCVHCCACCDKDNCLLLRSPASVHSCAQDSSVKNTEPFRIKPKPQFITYYFVNKKKTTIFTDMRKV